MPTKRIEFIDAMRGFTMFLVVLAHVSEYILLPNNPQAFSFSNIFSMFRMPMFFFISGFVLYKTGFEWNADNTIAFFKKKIPVQVLSPLLFLLLYCTLHSEYTFGNAIFHVNKYGYWFTFVLFVYFCLYIIMQWLFRLFHVSNWLRDALLLVAGLVVYLWTTHYVGKQSGNLYGLLSVGRWPYFLFFVIGTRVRKYYQEFERLLDTTWLTLLCLIVFIGLNFMPSLVNVSNMAYHLLLRLSGLIVVFAVFRKYQHNFSREHAFGRMAQFVGRRTLDIYLIHYFFLITNMQALLPDFSNLNSPFLELLTGTAVTIAIMACCLLVSAVLRVSPIAAHYLFGQKIEPRQ